ncbi:leucine-, isoleucine-, valine-, threonine-, and alanine-binding protein substrate-binding protein [Nitrospirillum viridazoti Y2]|uniref:Branched-chain amino acid transport system substrate-binding protein n=1 Tax=Nitrospirillum amazonense TaxID=28077 RepID=A0A560HWR7_9PROT|nr:leucine-, isoleucine-, valine-, threonine-, and alanine-binding protein substrate-binding protein [Nitrospirillum amazonense Y2]TWB49494.1 branched-chain amino acid transport system substrate-binding protein [Nitrospirillum amazonense]
MVRMKGRVAAVAIMVAAGLGAGAARAEIKLGLGAPLTGPNAVVGEQLRRGSEQAIKDLNAKGGVLGEQIVLIQADDASNPSQGVAAANKLITQGVVAVIGHYNSAVSIAAAKVYSEEGVVQISPGSTNPQLTEMGSHTTFRTCGRDDQQGEVAAQYIAKNFPKARIGILQDQTTYGRGLADATRAALAKQGLKEVVYEAVTVGDRDMSSVITRMKDAQVDFVYFGGLHTEAGLLVRQMAEKGLKAKFMAGDGIVSNEFWNITGAMGNGVLNTFGADYRQQPVAAEVVKSFRAQNYEPEAYTLYSYAAVQAWAQAVTTAKSTDPAKVADALHKGSFQTVIGPLSFNAKGDRTTADYTVYQWRDGSYTEVK